MGVRSDERRVELVRVPGARLHTEQMGDGPTLVLIPGGGGDAGMYEEILPLLAGRYSVISLDRRGNSRSLLEAGHRTETVMSEQVADIIAVLDHYRVDRAYVFGSSAGALITLELLATHADRLLGAVVHEPPIVQVLPDRAEQLAFFDEVQRITEAEGSLRAFLIFAAATMDRPPRIFSSSVGRAVVTAGLRLVSGAGTVLHRVLHREPDGMQRLLANADILMRSELPAFLNYTPDLERLREVPVSWRFAVGRSSTDRFYGRPAFVLAEELGVPCVEVPGGHTAYQEMAEEFAAELSSILDGMSG